MQPSVTVRMPSIWLWLFLLGGPALGCGLGFVAAPLSRWLLEQFDIVPGPLRFLAGLPLGWAVAVTTVLGIVGGIWLTHISRRESLTVTVGPSHVELAQDGQEVHLRRDDVADVRRDGSDLVLTDARGSELARRTAWDLSRARLRAAFERHGYPWGDGADDRFRRWVDGHPDLDAHLHELIRSRARALTDERRGAADELRDRLQAAGVVVRDRGGAQEFRLIAPETARVDDDPRECQGSSP